MATGSEKALGGQDPPAMLEVGSGIVSHEVERGSPSVLTAPATAGTPRHFGSDPGLRMVDRSSLPHLHAVTNLDFDVTENCNLGCVYCFKGEKYTENMSFQTMRRAFEWLLDASGQAESVNCNFMGGEPTLRWADIRRFVPWAKRRAAGRGKHATFSMTSNLTLWTQDIRDFVDQHGFGVLMSIDGCPDVQDAQRPAKNGRKTSEVIEYWARSMLQTRPRSTARATVHPKFAHRFFDSMKYLHGVGFSEVSVSASSYGEWTPEQLNALASEVTRTVNYIVEALDHGDDFNLTVFKYYLKFLVLPRARGEAETIEFLHSPCGAGKGYMMVDYTGDIWPCHRFDGADEEAGAQGQFRFGNVFEPGFNDELQRAFISFDHETMHKDSCSKCPVNPVCGGYCPAANLSETGSIYTPHETFCFWSQLLYRASEAMAEAVRKKGHACFDRLVTSITDVDGDGQR